MPDARKYTVLGGVTGAVRKRLEIDLGEPDPPEWNPEYKQRIKILPKQDSAGVSGVRERASGEKIAELADLELPKEIPPPFRTEFKIRTKDRPSIEYWNLTPAPNEPLIIPLRYQ